MYELKKNGKVFTSKFFGTGPPSYEKRIYRAAVSKRLSNTDLQHLSHSTTKQSQPFSPALLCVKCEKKIMCHIMSQKKHIDVM